MQQPSWLAAVRQLKYSEIHITRVKPVPVDSAFGRSASQRSLWVRNDTEEAPATVRLLYGNGGRCALMASSRGTAWVYSKSVTEFVDHHRRARSDDHGRVAAWFGKEAQIKQRAWDEAMKLVV